MEKNNAKRAERRAYYARLQRAARLKAEREYAEDEYAVWCGGMRPYPLLRRYIRYVRGDGHWLNGGCAIVQCSMCQHHGRSYRDLRALRHMDEDLRECFRAEHPIVQKEK